MEPHFLPAVYAATMLRVNVFIAFYFAIKRQLATIATDWWHCVRGLMEVGKSADSGGW